jgi:predicted nucleic acid-binding protein
MNFFIDTNVLIDFISLREPFGYDAALLFQSADEKKIKLHIAALSFWNTHYYLKKLMPESEVRKIFFELTDLVEIVPHTKSLLRLAIKSPHKDFEDAMQIVAAESLEDIEGIITRNKKDFKHSSLPLYLPKEALAFLS